VLDVYARAYDPKRPVVGLDEKPCQLIKDVLQPVRAKPGQVQRVDYEYERCGSANLFGWVEPLTGQRDVWVTERRTKREYAQALKRLVEAYPEAEMILLVQGPSEARTPRNNLNTHSKAALYEVFDPPEAHRIANKLEFHFTPRHGSWLNVQELEWSALARQALSERVGDRERLECLVEAWLQKRRERAVKIDWQFTTEDARVKLKRLYPIMTD
jgi:transposase